MKTFFAILAAGMITAGAAAAQSAPPAAAERQLGVEAGIPFADTVGIRNFQADGESALWIEDNRRLWYRAELMSRCWGLDHALKIGFVPRGAGTLDKFGEILVDGKSCQITSLKTSAPPPSKTAKAEKVK